MTTPSRTPKQIRTSRVARVVAGLCLALIATTVTLAALEWVIGNMTDSDRGYSTHGRRFVRAKEFVRDQTKNSLGFHDKEPALSTDGRTRVLLVGDSYVDSSSTPVEKSLGPLLEAHLDSVRPGGFEVIAVGRTGWGQRVQQQHLVTLLPELRPDVVVTLFLSLNDLTDDAPVLKERLIENDREIFRKRPGWSGLRFDDAPLLWFEGSELNRFVSFRLANLLYSGRRISDGTGSGIPFDYLVYAEEYDEDWREAWRIKERTVRSTAALVRKSGANYLLVSASTPHGVLGVERGVDWLERSYPAMRGHKWDLDKPDRLMREICREAGVPFLALEPAFREATAAGAELHWKHDGHWNAHGNDFAAARIAAFVIEELGESEPGTR